MARHLRVFFVDLTINLLYLQSLFLATSHLLLQPSLNIYRLLCHLDGSFFYYYPVFPRLLTGRLNRLLSRNLLLNLAIMYVCLPRGPCTDTIVLPACLHPSPVQMAILHL